MSHSPTDYHEEVTGQRWQQEAYGHLLQPAAGALHPTQAYNGSGSACCNQPDWEAQRVPYDYQHSMAYTFGKSYYPDQAYSQCTFPNTSPSFPESSFVDMTCGTFYAKHFPSAYTEPIPHGLVTSIHQSEVFPCAIEEHSSSVSTGTSKASQIRKNRPKTGKRFTWTDTLHRQFVNAIFTIGLKR
jgi:hypothetical protein